VHATEAARRLYETAQTQHDSSPPSKRFVRACREDPFLPRQERNWIRVHRGIYRLADFPPADRPDLMLWYLGLRIEEIPEGTYSHETALSLHELSDIMPSKLHMTYRSSSDE